MPVIFNKLPKREDKEIRMGKPDADYYPPGATEPQVRPANVPAPDAPAPNEKPEGVVVESGSVSNAVEEAKASFHEDVAKTSAKKAASKDVPKK